MNLKKNQKENYFSFSFRVRNLLVRIENRFSEACLLEFGQEGCLPTAENMAWLDIIIYCINHLLMTTPCIDTSLLEDQVSHYEFLF